MPNTGIYGEIPESYIYLFMIQLDHHGHMHVTTYLFTYLTPFYKIVFICLSVPVIHVCRPAAVVLLLLTLPSGHLRLRPR